MTPSDPRSALVGRRRRELPTPLLILDLDTARRNIETMAAWAREHAAVRPHAKAHKCPEIARLQLAAGAVGIATATVWEALAMIEAGIDRVLVANEIGDPVRASLLADAARAAEVVVGVDGEAGAGLLATAARGAGTELGVVIEVDIGMGRGGVRSPEEARALARAVEALPGLHLRGVMGWEGHTALERDRAARRREAAAAIAVLLEAADALLADGLAVELISAGGTNTYDLTGVNPRITDIQAGTYAVMDTSYAELAPAFEPVLSIVGTVLSRHGSRVVLDCGTKVQATMELAPPRLREGEGELVELHEEHALLDVVESATPRLGDRVEVLVSYAPGTVNLHDFYVVCEGEDVVDVWPIAGRGPGRAWTMVADR